MDHMPSGEDGRKGFTAETRRWRGVTRDLSEGPHAKRKNRRTANHEEGF
jgi:hypothetical protein